MNHPKKTISYRDAMAATNREAAASMALAVFLCAYFAASIFLTVDSEIMIFGFPLWFMTGVVGGFLLSFVGVALLLKFVFRDMPLDAEEMKK